MMSKNEKEQDLSQKIMFDLTLAVCGSGGILLLCGMKFESMNENIQMNQLKLLIIIVFVFALSSCGSISFAPASEKPSPKNYVVSKNVILDEDGNVIVKSGSHRDNRIGYYFDTKEGKCKQVFYSTGSDCVHPPFKTMEECLSCNGQKSAPVNR